MIVESEYVCDKTVLLVTTDAWAYGQEVDDEDYKRVTLNSFSEPSTGTNVPIFGQTNDVQT